MKRKPPNGIHNNSVITDTEKGKTKVTKKWSRKRKVQYHSETQRKENHPHRKDDHNITIKILESKKKINKPLKRSVLNKDIIGITFVKDCLASGMIKRAQMNASRNPDPNRKEQLKQKKKDYLHEYYLKHKLKRKKYNSEYHLKHKVQKQKLTKNQIRVKRRKYAHEYYLRHKVQNQIKTKNCASNNPKINKKERKNTKKQKKSQYSIENNDRESTEHDHSLSPPRSVDACYFNNQSTANMKKFHNSMQMVIIQCTVCKEARPVGETKAKSVSEKTYMCYRCKRDKTLPQKFSLDNNMIPSPVPPELQGLTQFEEMLISRAFPVIHVYTKPRGGQRAYKGHVITLPQDVQQLADILPRVPQDLPVIVFTINGKNNQSRDFQVRRQKVEAALHWLVRNNPLYRNVRIDPQRIQALPLDGNLSQVRKIDFTSDMEVPIGDHDKHQNSNNHLTENEAAVDIDRGPVSVETDEIVYDEQTEMSSFLPFHENTKKEKGIVSTLPQTEEEKYEWRIDDNPLNEFQTEFLATMSFPSLFPDAKGDPTNSGTVRNISENETESFALKIKHLIKFGEKINNVWKYRFASHPRFSYWAYNILYRKRLLGQGNFFIKQNPGEAALTIEELHSMLTTGNHSQIMTKLMHYAKNVTGTNAYWNQVKQQLRATINQVGSPTIFWTLSCADFHWPEFHSLFSGNNPTNDELRQNVIANPHILTWLFTQRTESFVKWWLYKSLNASWHWYRYEFAVQRGSIHCHGLAKLRDDPGLCELTKVALKGYLASKTKENTTLSEISLEDLTLIENDIHEGETAETKICNYVDNLMSTMNPSPPDECTWQKPGVHPCKKQFADIIETEPEEDYIDLLNMVQRHTICSSAYCLREKNDVQKCRFGYPIDPCNRTHLEFEKVNTKDGALRYRAKVVTARNDSRPNRHQRLQLQGWRANCDINIIIDYHSCVEYLTKYASKAEKLSDVVRDAFTSVVSKLGDEIDINRTIKKLMMKAVGQRDMSIQEVMHQILSLKLFSSSYQVVTVSLEGTRKLEVVGNDVVSQPSVLDDYANRQQFRDDYPGILKENLIQFVSKYYVKDKSLFFRPKMVVVRTFPSYYGNPTTPYYGSFCKYQLMKHKPWNTKPSTLWNDEEETDSTFIAYWNLFLQSDLGRELVPNWKHELDNISSYFDQVHDDDDFEEPLSGEREEWMLLAELNSSVSTSTMNTPDTPESYWESDCKNYTDEQIGNMPSWISTQKEQYNPQLTMENIIEIDTLNKEQHLAYTIVFDHFVQPTENNPLLLIITGLAGSGKSYLIDAIKNLLQEKCTVCAFFGVAAFNVKGKTLHSLLQLPINGRKSSDLKGLALNRLQDEMDGIRYLIIDEYSVIGQKMFGWINRRCKQATGVSTILFGGISVILVGDIGQLPPVSDKVIYHNVPTGEVGTEGYVAYRQFDKVVKLIVNQRAIGTSKKQQDFRKLQINARDGNNTNNEWEMLLERTPLKIEDTSTFETTGVKLSYGNEKVAKDNYTRLLQLNSPIAVIKAKHNNKTASKLSADDMGSLQPQILLTKGARVMLTKNLWTEVGLINGAMGSVKHIIYQHGHSHNSLPIAVIVQFDDTYIGPSICPDIPNCVPITPIINTSDTLGSAYERQQIPLRLSWSMTIHKSQGLTLAKAWVDLGKTEKAPGMAYVALSRVRSLDDLIIEPMTFERLHAIKKCSNYKFRIQEEQRLDALAKSTMRKYRYLST